MPTIGVCHQQELPSLEFGLFEKYDYYSVQFTIMKFWNV